MRQPAFRAYHLCMGSPDAAASTSVPVGQISRGNRGGNCVVANDYPIEYEDQPGSVARPTLVVTGQLDRTCTPRAARDLHAGIPGSELVIIPDAGHQTFIEQPGMYFAAVRDFFTRHPERI